MTKLRIIFLHMTMGITNRGSEGVVDALATELSKRHDVMVIQSGKVESKPYAVKRVYPQSEAPSVAPKNLVDKLLFRLHLDFESGAVASFTSEAESELIKFDPDIIVAVNGPLQVRILQGLALQAKIVTFGHAGIGYHDKDTLSAKPDLFVALSPASYDWATKLGHRKTKVVYIPNPVVSKKAKKINLDLPSPVVLTVAALSKYKNVDRVISAVQRTTASYLLIGDGEESDRIAEELSTYPGEFRWIRSLDPTEILSYYKSSDVFCFVPSPQEAFGMVYLEAMAAGLPIVASDDPIRRKLIGEKGIYVDPHNPTDVENGINRALCMGRVDYSEALIPYALKTVVYQIEKELHDLI